MSVFIYLIYVINIKKDLFFLAGLERLIKVDFNNYFNIYFLKHS